MNTLPEILEMVATYGPDSALPLEAYKTRLDAFMQQATPDEQQAVREAIGAKTRRLLDEADEAIREAENFLHLRGRTYDLDQWLTVAQYAKKHNLSANRVYNWIRRGLVPEHKRLTVPELNDTTLIFDQLYLDEAA